MCAKTTSGVPTVQDTAPGSRIPLATALAVWSPPPPTSGVPSARPVRSRGPRGRQFGPFEQDVQQCAMIVQFRGMALRGCR